MSADPLPPAADWVAAPQMKRAHLLARYSSVHTRCGLYVPFRDLLGARGICEKCARHWRHWQKVKGGAGV